MKNRTMITFCLVLCAQVVSYAQQPALNLPTLNLKSFFEKRLSDNLNTPPPSYEALLAVIDSISGSTPVAIQSTLPLLSVALNSKIPNVPVEAVFAFFAISRRSDGGTILRSRVPEIASLMASPDERLGGGSVNILRNLTRSIPDATVPLMINELRSPSRPNLVKAEIVRALLESSKRNDEQVLRSVEAYVALNTDPVFKVANLLVIAASRIKTPALAGYIMSSLDDKDKHVQIAAIQTVYALNSDMADQARVKISLLASDPNVDQEVRSMADRAMKNKLADPYKVPEPPELPKRKGIAP